MKRNWPYKILDPMKLNWEICEEVNNFRCELKLKDPETERRQKGSDGSQSSQSHEEGETLRSQNLQALEWKMKMQLDS